MPLPNHTLAHIHALRTYLRGIREAYRWDLFCAHRGKRAVIHLELEPLEPYVNGQQSLMEAAKQSLLRVRKMERMLDKIIAELREEANAAPEPPTEAWLLAWRGG